MADFAFCVNEALKAGKLTKASADRILSSSDPEAELDNIVLDLSRQKKETMIQAVRLQQSSADMSSIGDSAEGLMALMAKSEKAGYANVETLSSSIAAKFHARNADMLSRFRTRSLGLSQDAAGLRQLVRALYGESVDDSTIAAYAKTLSESYEDLRQAFNRAGGSISKNEQWIAPQIHNARAINNLGLERWKEKVLNYIDRTKMVDDNGKQLTAQQLDEALDYVFETITTGGLNKVKDLTVPRLGSKLARKHSDRRFLYFKDAESWLKYNEEFGKADILTTLTDHIDSMSHDIALMQRFGPNPNQAYEALRAMALKEGGGKVKIRHADKVWNVASGKIGAGELVGVADLSQSASNLITASTLGSAFLSALSDTAFNAMTSAYRGMGFLNSLGRQMRLMNPANEADRIFAVRLGLGAESWTNRANAANRFADVYGVGPTAKVSEFVMRGSLLSPWTQAGRHGFGMEFSAMLADNFGKTFDQLDDALKKGFSEYDITAKEWDVFRKTPTLDQRGAPYADFTQEGSEPFQRMVLSEMDFAVPTPDYRVKGITTGGLERASITGQGWRAVMMLKSFPLTLIFTHFARAANQATLASKLQYMAVLTASTTILGGIALQAKDIAAGREPRNIDKDGSTIPDGDFLAAAMQQGGGFGIYGDFIFSDQNRFGESLADTLAGPKVGMVEDIVDFTIGNVQQAVRGDETDVLGEAAKLAGRYQPKIWQTRLFQDALVDQLEIIADDDAQSRFNRQIRNRQRDFDQDYWWKPGEPLPEAFD